jgi:hypothetical protein
MTINKFWTIKDGKIGTAHINRNGDVVDFREWFKRFYADSNKSENQVRATIKKLCGGKEWLTHVGYSNLHQEFKRIWKLNREFNLEK